VNWFYVVLSNAIVAVEGPSSILELSLVFPCVSFSSKTLVRVGY
jgi:hypothetical protein